MKTFQRAGDLMKAIASLPEDHYVTFSKELDDDSKEPDDEGRDADRKRHLLSTCVFQKAPEGGWPSSGARFRDPPSSPSHAVPCPSQWQHDDSVLFGITARSEEPEVLEGLLVRAITERWSGK